MLVTSFCMCACQRDVVFVSKMGACIHGVLISYVCLLSQFHGNEDCLASLEPLLKVVFSGLLS